MPRFRARLVGAACTLLVAACGSSLPPSDAGTANDAGCVPFDAGTPNAALAQQGIQILEARNCQKCHGELLSGNDDGVQISGTNITQYPPNLTGDPATGLGCWTDDQVVRAILYGIDNEGAVICPPMPQWADAGMTVSDAQAVVAFLRTLAPVINNVAQGPSCTCATSADCTDGLFCTNLICELGAGAADGGSDAGATDAGAVDAGNADAGNADAGNVDAGGADAGNPDGGMADAGSIDGGTEDAGVDDAGVDAGSADAGDLDAGSTDAGDLDAGSADAGSADAGVADAGTDDAGTDDAGTDAGTGDAGPAPKRPRRWRH